MLRFKVFSAGVVAMLSITDSHLSNFGMHWYHTTGKCQERSTASPPVPSARWREGEAESPAKRRTMEAAPLGIRCGRSINDKQHDELHTSHDQDRAGGQPHEEQDESKPPSQAARIAALTLSVLQRTTDDGETMDRLYLDFMESAKREIMNDLKEVYKEIHYYSSNPSSKMPRCLSQRPPRKRFFTPELDGRLESRVSQIKEDLKSFVEEQGFVCRKVHYLDGAFAKFCVELQLDVADVPI